MAVAANSYGTASGVGGLTPRHANIGGTFDSTTRPTLAQVESYVDQVSGILNSFLAQAGFTVPVTQTDVKSALTLFVQEEVAAIVEGVNNAGRFGPTAKAPGRRGRFATVTEEAKSFIDQNASGFELLGAPRTAGGSSSLSYLDDNEPFFNRSQEWE